MGWRVPNALQSDMPNIDLHALVCVQITPLKLFWNVFLYFLMLVTPRRTAVLAVCDSNSTHEPTGENKSQHIFRIDLEHMLRYSRKHPHHKLSQSRCCKQTRTMYHCLMQLST